MSLVQNIGNYLVAMNEAMQEALTPAVKFLINHHEAAVNISDIVSFLLVTPELIKRFGKPGVVSKWVYLISYVVWPVCMVWTDFILYKAIQKTHDKLHISYWWLAFLIPGNLRIIGFLRHAHQKAGSLEENKLNVSVVLIGAFIFVSTRIFAITCAVEIG